MMVSSLTTSNLAAEQVEKLETLFPDCAPRWAIWTRRQTMRLTRSLGPESRMCSTRCRSPAPSAVGGST